MKKLVLFILSLMVVVPALARDLGDISQDPFRYRVNSKSVLNVRSQPNTQSAVRLTLRNGDYVYGYPVDAEWLKVYSEQEWYVSSRYLVTEDNPHYMQALEEDHYSSDRIYRIQRVVRWVLLGLCILFLGGFMWWFLDEWGIPFFELSTERKGFKGNDGKVYFMHQKFYYGAESYLAVLGIVATILVAMVAGVATLLAVGGVVWLLMWVVWLILMALVIVGWIGLVGGILCLFGDDETKGMGCGGIVIGGVIVGFADSIKSFGDAAVDMGFAFFRNLNVLDFARDLAVIYWKPALLIALSPLALFLGLVLLTMLISGVLMLIEWLVMWHYNVKNPCPACQKPSEPAIYLSQGEPLPVSLHPGRFGLFHITHPVTREKMPTMLFNGKGQCPRRCRSCGELISAQMGSEKHVALAGVAESGKTALLYRLTGEWLRNYPQNIRFTDEENYNDYDTTESIRRIAEVGYMEELPRKTQVGRYRAIQLLIQGRQQISYRLFLNDMAGELYGGNSTGDLSASEVSANVQFVHNVQSILFMVDPMTIKFSKQELKRCSKEFQAWYEANESPIQRFDIHDAFRRLVQFFEQQHCQLDRVKFNFVLTKSDMGYLLGADPADEQQLRDFMGEDLGLGPLLLQAEKSFDKVHYFAVSAVSRGREGRMFELSEALLDQLSIK